MDNRYSVDTVTESLVKRFRNKYKTGQGCWEWTAFKDSEGYGWIRKGSNKEPVVAAHRLSWIIANKKDWPTGLIARHLCNNSSCVNPDHITPGTSQENANDKMISGSATFRRLSCVHCRLESGINNFNRHLKVCS